MYKISIEGLQKTYKNKRLLDPVLVLYNLDLNVNPGEILVLLGESGCGKTTLLKVIAGIEDFDYGDITFDGANASKILQIDKNMSYVSQNYVLYPHKTVYENIDLPLSIQRLDKNVRKEKILEIAKLLDMEILLGRKPRQLSGGQQQRVAIARALVKKPDICLLDEPLAALDVIYHDEILKLINDIHKKTNTTFIYSTHQQNEAFRIADRIAIMHNYKIEQIGKVNEIIKHPNSLYVAKFLTSIFNLFIDCKYIDGKLIYSTNEIVEKKLDNVESEFVTVCFTKNSFIESKDGNFICKVIDISSQVMKLKYEDIEFEMPTLTLENIKIGDQIKYKILVNELIFFNEKGENLNE